MARATSTSLLIFPGELRIAAKWADIIHVCDHSNAFYVKYISSRPHIVTCHDLLAISSALKEVPENRTSMDRPAAAATDIEWAKKSWACDLCFRSYQNRTYPAYGTTGT